MRTETATARFTAAEFRARVLARGVDGLDREGGEPAFEGDPVYPNGFRDAAVLVPVVDREADATVILTTRSAGLRKHGGQISFPGGSVDPGDASPEAAALREAREEIALDPRFVEPVGRLPRYRTRTGFLITPVLAVVRPGFSLVPDPAEVADTFEVPLRFLMDPGNHTIRKRLLLGREREVYHMPFGDREIWGITAGILRTLYERLYA